MTLVYFVCKKCLSGFREDSREFMEMAGQLGEGNACKCGGVFEPVDKETALGKGGVLETCRSRLRGIKPS